VTGRSGRRRSKEGGRKLIHREEGGKSRGMKEGFGGDGVAIKTGKPGRPQPRRGEGERGGGGGGRGDMPRVPTGPGTGHLRV